MHEEFYGDEQRPVFTDIPPQVRKRLLDVVLHGIHGNTVFRRDLLLILILETALAEHLSGLLREGGD